MIITIDTIPNHHSDNDSWSSQLTVWMTITVTTTNDHDTYFYTWAPASEAKSPLPSSRALCFPGRIGLLSHYIRERLLRLKILMAWLKPLSHHNISLLLFRCLVQVTRGLLVLWKLGKLHALIILTISLYSASRQGAEAGKHRLSTNCSL